GAAGVQFDLEEVLRVRIVGDPAEREYLEVAPIDVTQEDAQLLLLDLYIDAEVVLPQGGDRRDCLAGRRALTGCQQGYVAQYVRAARLVEKGLSSFGIVRNAGQVLVISWHAGWQNALRGQQDVHEDALSDQVPVRSHRECLPHGRVVERRF